jgi:hypothetical protein
MNNTLAFDSVTSTIFNSNYIIAKIVNNTKLEQNKQCNKLFQNLVNENFICVFIHTNETNILPEYKFTYNFFQIIFDVLINNEFKTLINNDYKYYKNIHENFLLFYSNTILPIKYVIKNILKYLIMKLKIIFLKLYDYIKDEYKLDEKKEEIILPMLLIPNKIKYFTENTINNYDNCEQLLNSLKNSLCFTTKVENIENEFLQ